MGDEGPIGLITYMRTDSTRISDDALGEVRAYIGEKYGPTFLPAEPVVFKTKKGAQDAHEAIRPTYAGRSPGELKELLGRDELRLYTMVYNRFLACQMVPALYDGTTVDVVADNVELRATGSVLRFDGYLAAYRAVKAEEPAEEPAGDDDAEAGSGMLPPDLAEGMPLALQDLAGDQRFTEPAPRFSEATLVRELEERGIGRPSTYATIVTTIQSKGYVAKNQGKLRPSELGRVVNDLLVAHFKDIVDYDFTARLEQELDEVEEGRKGRLDVLGDFWKAFEGTLDKAKTEMRSVKAEAIPAGVDCDQCGKPMLIRFGKNGSFLGCSGWPACRNTREFARDENGQVAAAPAEDVGACPKCSSPLLVRSGRFGKFVACSTYPQCDFTRPYTREEHCPVDGCDGLLAEKVSKKGRKFFSCSNYPKCRFVSSEDPVAQPCPACGAPTLFAKGGRATSRSLRCLREGCGWKKRGTRNAEEAAEAAETPEATEE
jgi:DNA topoisomerase-1